MIITKIEQQKNKERYSVYLDGEFAFGIDSDTLVAYHNIRLGAELDENEIAEIVDSAEKRSAYSCAFKYVSRSARTEKEIRTKLKKCVYTSTAVDYALSKLKEYDLVNDKKYAELYISSYPNKGRMRLTYELINKGVDKKVAEEVLDAVLSEEDEQASCDALASTLYEKLNDREKVMRRLVSKGYSYSMIQSSLDRVNENDD